MVLHSKKEINGLSLLLAVTYMVSYMTRVNYGAVIAEMVTETGAARSAFALALTGSFVTYGLGQVVSGLCADRFSPKKLVACGLAATTVMNGLIVLCRDPFGMLAVWSVNGFAQAFLWPPMVRIMTARLSPQDYDRVVVRVSWGSSMGTVLVYLISPVLITLAGWRSVFLCSAACGCAMFFVWNGCCCDVPVERKRDRGNTQSGGILFSPLMLCVMAAIVLQGMLRDGVTTWMPSYIAETYSLSNQSAILSGVVLPLFSVLSLHAASLLYRKRLTDPMLCAAVIFVIGGASALALLGAGGKQPALSVLFSALLTGSMHGVNLIQTGIIPSFFRKYGNVATVSGVLNSCTYVGSAISTYGIAVLSETMGWNGTILLWVVIAAGGALLSLACVKGWQKRFYETGSAA